MIPERYIVVEALPQPLTGGYLKGRGRQSEALGKEISRTHKTIIVMMIIANFY